jgi:DUF4097 and DUF4098 domain-containing protein YvlB
MKNYHRIMILLLALTSFITLAGEQVNKQLPAGNAKDIRIENLRGSVVIEGWDQGIVSVKGELDDKAKAFVFEKKGSEIVIKVVMPKHITNLDWIKNGSALVVKVPDSMRLTFKGVSSNVRVKSLTRSSKVKTVNGDIDAEDLSGHVELFSVNGNIKSKNLRGKIELSTVSGDIKDEASKGKLFIKAISGSVSSNSLASEVKAKCVSGSINLTLTNIDQLAMSTVSGEVSADLFLNASGIVKMSSVSGDIALKLLNNSQAKFSFSANAGGDIVNKLTADKAVRGKHHASTKLNFVTGDGSGSVRGSTVSGTIKISD